ncbi:MAG: hypothetical protein JW757_13655 [Anaerolineales bacterium]|nr:hypothetical protein [Anaerolineales bacterium]
MNALSVWLSRISKGWLTLTFTILMTAFMIWVLPDQSARAEAYSGDVGSPDTSFFYRPQKLFQIAEAYGEAGRQAYVRARFTFDLIFPLVYGGFLISTISWFLNRFTTTENRLRLLNLVPLVGVLFDFLENIAASVVIGAYPLRLELAALLASAFTLMKWLFVNGSFIVLLVVFILWLGKRKNPQTSV